MTTPPLPAHVRLLSAALLRLYPSRVREAFGGELRAAWEDAWMEERATRGPAGRALALVRLIADAARAALAFRLGLRPALRAGAAANRSGLMTGLAVDLKLAVRSLLRGRAVTATAVLILAVGIAAMTAITTLVYHVLLRPLPYPDPARLVMIWDVQRSAPGEPHVVAPGNIADWREQAGAFEGIAVFNLSSLTLEGAEGRERVPGAQVTTNYFDVLGVQPRLGAGFAPQDDGADSAPGLILSHGFWTRRFGADRSLVGRTIRVGTLDLPVLGVMPPDFRGPDEHYFGRADYWVPMRIRFEDAGRGGHYLRTVARLKPGVTLEQAQEDIRRIADRSSLEHPETNAGWTAAVVPLHDELVSGVRPLLLMLLVAVVLVHVTVCANVANLLLSRGVARRREYAICAAIGATRRRIVRSILAESVLLSLAGAAGGLLIAAWLVRAVAMLIPDLPRAESLDLQSLGTIGAVAAAVLTAALFGVLPALGGAGRDPWGTLQSSGRSQAAGRTRLRRALVVAEIAGSVTLLIAAALLSRSFLALASEPAGFSAAGVLTARIGLPPAGEAGTAANHNAASGAIAEIESLPGMQAAGFTTSLPFAGLNNVGLNVRVRTREGERDAQIRYRAVTPRYLEALQVRLIAGRLLTDSDLAGAPGAVVINDAAARQYAGEDPIGAPIRIDFGRPFEGTIVGIIAGVRHDDLSVRPEPELFVPYAQHPVMSTLFLAARSDGPLPSAAALRDAVRRAVPRATLEEVTPLTDLVGRSVATERMNALLLAALAAVAGILALVGLYAVIAHGVAQRVREIGIRLALGASRSQIRRLVVVEGVRLAGMGVCLGAVGAYLAGGLLQRLLYSIDPHDGGTFAAVAVSMAVVAAAASYLPARSASRVGPIVSLRME